MIAVDTNVLVYAHREDSSFHERARGCVDSLSNGRAAWAIRVAGPQVHDARIAALCRQHGVRELWSADRDFGRFPGLHVSNPLVTASVQSDL
ncbi:MAG: type II toxin-antitoxin system VapC family toxin [Gammaproteobacteria bacterium]